MKSKIKTIFLILIIIVLAAVYAVIDKPVSVYDTSCDTSKFQAQVLEEMCIRDSGKGTELF